jgi:hypothetical protein
MSLNLKKFDMKSISFKSNESKDSVVTLIGRRDTGISWLVRALVYYNENNTNKNIDNDKVEISNK